MVETIVKLIAEEFGCDKEMILFKGRKRNMPRDIAIYLARDLTGESGVRLGEYFGNTSGAGITVRYTHLSNTMSKNPKLKTQVNRLRKRIINN
jgi:chromosomal replication initiator protein